MWTKGIENEWEVGKWKVEERGKERVRHMVMCNHDHYNSLVHQYLPSPLVLLVVALCNRLEEQNQSEIY